MEEKKYILSIDSGTTSVRSLLIDHQGGIVAQHSLEFNQIFPKSGWVEHNALEIWNSQKTTIQTVKKMAQIKSFEIAAVGITNQRETIVAFDKETGTPVYNAIVWQDQRTSEFCSKLIADGWEQKIQEKTGLLINPYFSGTKINWILKNVPKAQELLKKDRLLVGTIDAWLIWNLTNGKSFYTDVTNASRTLLYNIKEQKWDQEILDLLEIPKKILPEVKACNDEFGIVDSKIFSPNSTSQIKIHGVIGDQQSSLFGHMCVNKGDIKNTYGTGCFTLVNIGNEFILSKNRLLTTIAWKLKDEEINYAFEGSVFIAGAAIQWLRDALKMVYNAAETDFLAEYAEKNNDENKTQLYIVPAFTGLGAPYWDSHARGAIFGIERSTKKEDFVKATLEAIGFQTNDLIEAIEEDIKQKICLLKVDGGVTNSKYLMQFQSSISNVEIQKSKNFETTALGAAYMAGLGIGFWKSINELAQNYSIDQSFLPLMDRSERAKLIKGWNEAIKRTLNWTKAIE